MRVADLFYELPPELVARYPAERRDESRMLVLGREGEMRGRRVRDLAEELPAGCLLVVNDTAVMPARLLGQKASGGRFELLLVERVDGDELRWRALVRTHKRVRLGQEAKLDGGLEVRVDAGPNDEGLFEVALRPPPGRSVLEVLEEAGHMPLPPYLQRADEPADRERYQTIFASEPGAVAAPTAGLHFTPELVQRLAEAGIAMTTVTLHVGPGTFKPVKVAELDDHPMHGERYAVPPEAAKAIAEARRRGAPVVAVGTTVVRTLESAADPEAPGEVCATSGETHLLIQPGFRFQVVDGLLTNFHLPGSTLLALVYALAGPERVRAAYALAIRERYRFYSYGDAMLIPPPDRPARQVPA
ncbi:MAG: tRNA preQ1(34) S-adenosylmethionine ribosyltransferase-isomerase QueA [Myxococcales bacterium]|nr:tRNA preQ1(34) S-adenosylmethionine ribosyltransferase-isomerase QueA [Myxococcales bacterium]